MKHLTITDILISLIVGCTISFGAFQLQKSDKRKKASLRNKHSAQRSIASVLPSSTPSSQQLNKRRISSSAFRQRLNNSNPTFISKNVELEPGEDPNELIHDLEDSDLPQEESEARKALNLFLEKKTENYLINTLQLSYIEASQVMIEKKRMEDEMVRNNQLINIYSPEQIYKFNEEILANYNNNLKQLLGLVNYQKYSEWQSAQDAAISESYAGGRPYPMDENSLQN